MTDHAFVQLMANNNELHARIAELEKAILHGASDLQPVIALATVEGPLGETGCHLLQRTYGNLCAVLTTAPGRVKP